MTPKQPLIEVKRNPSESTPSLLRRFSKRVTTAGILKLAKKRRYHERRKSNYKKKQEALKRLKSQAEWRRMYKLGKIKERHGHGRS